MHVNLMHILVDFFDPLSNDASQLADSGLAESASFRQRCNAVELASEDVLQRGYIFSEALSEFSSADSAQQNPERVRSATTNLIRAVELFKTKYSALSPDSGVRNHPEVGCLYGYSQPRTATLDKAALVAQETMIDLWSLSSQELQTLAVTTSEQYTQLTRTIGTLIKLCRQDSMISVAA